MDKKQIWAGVGLVGSTLCVLSAIGLNVDGTVIIALVGFATLCLGILTGTKLNT